MRLYNWKELRGGLYSLRGGDVAGLNMFELPFQQMPNTHNENLVCDFHFNLLLHILTNLCLLRKEEIKKLIEVQ